MMLKVFLLVVAYSIFVDGRKLDRLFWDDDSYETTKRSYQQVCEDVKVEKLVSTSTLIENDQLTYPDLFPKQIMKTSCKTEGRQASDVSDSSIICKTKEKQVKVIEFNGDRFFAIHNAKVPTDCVAYKI